MDRDFELEEIAFSGGGIAGERGELEVVPTQAQRLVASGVDELEEVVFGGDGGAVQPLQGFGIGIGPGGDFFQGAAEQVDVVGEAFEARDDEHAPGLVQRRPGLPQCRGVVVRAGPLTGQTRPREDAFDFWGDPG